MRVLVIEGDKDYTIRNALARGKRASIMDHASGVQDAEAFCRYKTYGAIALNASACGLAKVGTWIGALRVAGSTALVEVVSGPIEAHARAILLRAGADDQVSAPLDPNEFLARLEVLERRIVLQAGSVLTAGNVSMDTGTMILKVNGRQVKLTGRMWDMFKFLMLRAGRMVTRDQIIDATYEEDKEPEIKLVDVNVCRLRKLLADAGVEPKDFIQTVYRSGFRIDKG